jgi:hypothetical protein
MSGRKLPPTLAARELSNPLLLMEMPLLIMRFLFSSIPRSHQTFLANPP